uniref:Protein FAM151A n=1 Tax=Astyanax mexicanus TaxID=7994 RepID=A0A3B1K9T3_ASTMX
MDEKDKRQEEQRKRRKDEEENKEEEEKKKAGVEVLTRQQILMLCVGLGLVLLLVVITVTSVLLTVNSDPGTPETMVPFPTDGDMLEFLVRNGELQEKDGLYATWYHAANSKAEMNEALESGVMILEADVNVEGHNTANETNIPIMAHPPDVYSDNTLEEWLDAVLKSKKGIKLDFKSLQSVGPSLDLLRIKNQTGINRPVWINADILPGPNVPNFWPVINATVFFDLIEKKFPDVTISPGWKVLYLSLLPNATYSRAMVEQMYDAVKHLPQKITFPVLAVMGKNGWPHLSWLLSQSSRFSLTLWQGEENPTVNDLLFIRDNSNPQRIYYDINELVLSQFKEASKQKNRRRRFYPGGDIVNYFKPADDVGLNILWETVTDRPSLLSILKESPGGMLEIPVTSGVSSMPKIPVVESTSQPELPLQDCLHLILSSQKSWGIYLRIKSPNQLANSLQILQQAYANHLLHHPTWINMDVAHGSFNVHGYISGQEFLKTIDLNFPYVTITPSWPNEVLDQGYTPQLVDDMVELYRSTWQDVSLQVDADRLQRTEEVRRLSELLQREPRFSITVDFRRATEDFGRKSQEGFLASLWNGNKQRIFYNMPKV